MHFNYDGKNTFVDFTNEFETIEASDDADFVEKLRDSSRIPDYSVPKYMEHFSQWNLLLDAIKLRHDTIANFVSDLKSEGYLKVENGVYTLHTMPNSV